MAVALAVVNSTTSGTIVSFIISLVVKADKVLDAWVAKISPTVVAALIIEVVKFESSVPEASVGDINSTVVWFSIFSRFYDLSFLSIKADAEHLKKMTYQNIISKLGEYLPNS